MVCCVIKFHTTVLYDSLSGILQYDMIAYYLFVTYDICGRVSVSKLDWGGYYYFVHILVSRIVLYVLGLLLISV